MALISKHLLHIFWSFYDLSDLVDSIYENQDGPIFKYKRFRICMGMISLFGYDFFK